MTTMTNKTIPARWSLKTFDENVNKITSVLGESSPTIGLLREAAVQAILHAYDHGDPVYCKRLYDAVSKVVRKESLRIWFGAMAPITVKKNKNGESVWAMKKEWSKDKDSKFHLQEAVNTPFDEYTDEKVSDFSGASALKTILGLVKKTDSYKEKERFKGDAEKTKAVLSNIASFADAQFKKLTPAERGEAMETTEQVILDAAIASKTPDMAEAHSVN